MRRRQDKIVLKARIKELKDQRLQEKQVLGGCKGALAAPKTFQLTQVIQDRRRQQQERQRQKEENAKKNLIVQPVCAVGDVPLTAPLRLDQEHCQDQEDVALAASEHYQNVIQNCVQTSAQRVAVWTSTLGKPRPESTHWSFLATIWRALRLRSHHWRSQTL